MPKTNPNPYSNKMHLKIAIVALILAVTTTTQAQTLSTLYEADQSDRQPDIPRNERKIDWPTVRQHDAARREQVRTLIQQGAVKSAEDYYHAAVIFQHGEADQDYELAHALAVISITLDPKPEDPRYMTAATWDRYLTHKGKPQWYGTQFKRDEAGKWVLLPVESGAVSDDERKRLAVPTLAESQAEMDKLNASR